MFGVRCETVAMYLVLVVESLVDKTHSLVGLHGQRVGQDVGHPRTRIARTCNSEGDICT